MHSVLELVDPAHLVRDTYLPSMTVEVSEDELCLYLSVGAERVRICAEDTGRPEDTGPRWVVSRETALGYLEASVFWLPNHALASALVVLIRGA